MSSTVQIILTAVDQASGVINNALSSAGGSMQKFSTTAFNLSNVMTVVDTGMRLGSQAVRLMGDAYDATVGETMDYAKAVRDVARYTGTSYEESSKLLQVADDLQLETQTLKVGFRNLAKEGIQPSIENLKALAIEYQSLTSPVEKAQFAMEKFGARSGMEMAKMLELTAEQIDNIATSAEDLGLVLDAEAIQATEDYRLAVDELDDAWNGLTTTIGVKAVPALTSFVTLMKEMVSLDSDTWFQDGADASANFINSLFGLEAPASNLEEIFRKTKDDLVQTVIEFGDYTLWGNKVFETSGDIAAGVGGAAAAFERMQAAAAGINKSLGEIKFDFLMEGFGNFSDNIVQQTALLLTYKRIMGEINEVTYQSSMAKLDELNILQRLNDGAATGIVTQGEYFNVIKDGTIGIEEVNDAFGETTDLMNKNIERFGVAGESIDQFASAAQSSISDVEGSMNGLTGSAGTAAGAIGGVKSAMDALSSKTVTLTVQINYVEAAGGWKGGAGIWKERQHGGPVAQGMPYIVGEAGPELFVPKASGSIVPNNQIAGGGNTYIIHNHSAAAAALTAALVSQNKRMRLQRSMGG